MLARSANALRQFLTGAEKLFFTLANLCLLLMLVLNIVNIGWRGAMDKSLNFVWPWTGLLFVWMCFFGFFIVYRKSKDITVDYFVDLAGEKARRFTRVMSGVIIVALMLLLLFEAPRTLGSQVGDMELIEMERYWMRGLLFAAAALVMRHFVLDLIDAALGVPEPRKRFDVPE